MCRVLLAYVCKCLKHVSAAHILCAQMLVAPCLLRTNSASTQAHLAAVC
jgi:hypothetical protein